MAEPAKTVKVVLTLPDGLKQTTANIQQRGDKKKSTSSPSNVLEFEINQESEIGNIKNYLQLTDSTKFLPDYSLVSSATNEVVDETVKINELKGVSMNSAVNFKLKLSPYDTKKSILHVLSLRNNLGFVNELDDDLSEIAISSAPTLHKLDFVEKRQRDSSDDKETKSEQEETTKTFDISTEERAKFNSIVSSTLEQTLPISQLLDTNESVITSVLRSLNFSQYNPVPSVYRARGHTIYLQAITWEAETFHITGTSTGFFLNKSNSNKFDPNPKDELKFITLYDLISNYSKKFDQHFQEFTKNLTSIPMLSYAKPITGVLNKPWLIKPSVLNNYGDYFRLQHSDLLPFENKINFNSDFQSIKDLDTEDITNRISAEKSLIRIVDVFTKTAIKGAMKIASGEMDPYMGGSDENDILSKTFYEDNIFYSYVHDFGGINQEKGGDEYSFSIANSDLKTTKALNKTNPVMMRYRLMCLVDYCGKRILCEAPVAGLLTNTGVKIAKDEKSGNPILTEELMEEYTKVIYGTNANAEIDGKDTETIVYDSEFNDSLDEIAKSLHLKPHVIDGKEFKVSSAASGLIGTDKRKYLVNLNNLSPTDINFTTEHYDEVKDLSKRYVHRHIKLRHELVDAWWSIKTQELDIEKCFNEYEFSFNADDEQDPVSKELSTFLVEKIIPNYLKDILDENAQLPFDGAHLIDNLHKNGINVRYLYKLIELIDEEMKVEIEKKAETLEKIEQANVEHKKYEEDMTKKIEDMLIERQKKINELVQAGKEVPEDLKMENLKIDENEIRKPITDSPFIVNYEKLVPLKKIAQLEIVSRSLKHILRKYSTYLPVSVVPTLINHIYNLLFGSSFNESPELEFLDSFYSATEYAFAKMTRADLLQEITSQAAIRFRYDLSAADLEALLTDKPFVLIRNLNKKFGIQMTNREYFFTAHQYEAFLAKQEKKALKTLIKQTSVFSAKDFSVIPVTKDCEYVSGLVSQTWNTGAIGLSKDSEDEQKQFSEAMAFLNQSIAWREEFFGVVHESVGESYLKLSSIYSKIGKLDEAIVLARKAAIIFERTCGLDSFLVIRSLLNLVILETANDCPYNAIQLSSKIFQIADSCTFDEHPILIHCLNDMKKLAIGCKETKQAINILMRMNDLVDKYNGGKTCAYAMNLSTMANLYASQKDIATSLKAIEEAYTIFSTEVGLNHNFTATSQNWMQSLSNILESQRAQKKANATQAAVAAASTSKANKKQDPKLMEKSVNELVEFIEGGNAGNAKKSSTKNKKKKGKK